MSIMLQFLLLLCYVTCNKENDVIISALYVFKKRISERHVAHDEMAMSGFTDLY